ncbi:hypothetical protein FM110_04955 [Brachybacterium nesterenkovii]|uniref:Uncharacterized protein n=1 Tax=Brachybacterium nesterenkovii TaxID=47847 RepID=A0A1X6WXD4_9MICO|nr:hypothetical protein FM110_04955 [Brachybacterium nesterenkovii]
MQVAGTTLVEGRRHGPPARPHPRAPRRGPMGPGGRTGSHGCRRSLWRARLPA